MGRKFSNLIPIRRNPFPQGNFKSLSCWAFLQVSVCNGAGQVTFIARVAKCCTVPFDHSNITSRKTKSVFPPVHVHLHVPSDQQGIKRVACRGAHQGFLSQVLPWSKWLLKILVLVASVNNPSTNLTKDNFQVDHAYNTTYWRDWGKIPNFRPV